MRACPTCRAEYQDDTSYCSGCGTRMTALDTVADDPMERVGTVLGSYRLLDLIGLGGMGEVYLAEHTRLGRRVALKMLRSAYIANPQAIRRFFAEARAVNRIHHPNIIEITDFVESERGDNYYVMELLDGHDLARMLALDEPLSLSRTLHIAIEMSSALAAVHGAGIVHRDFKPDNVFVVKREGRDFAKLLDFGIAKLAEGDVQPTHRTASGMILGTPEYMAPEQAAGGDIDHRSDIFAFGLVVYEMLAGERPFADAKPFEFDGRRAAIATHVAETLRQSSHTIPEALTALVQRCVQYDPAQRPKDMGEVEQELRSVLAALPSDTNTVVTRAVGVSWPRWIALAALGVLASAGGVVLLTHRSAAPHVAMPPEPSATVPPIAIAAPPEPSAPPPATTPSVRAKTPPPSHASTRHPEKRPSNLDRNGVIDPFQ